jgi:hemerythrin
VTLLTWKHDCIVGVKAMDDQHSILMDTLNELHVMLVQGRAHKEICDQLGLLVEFTQLHFTCEEQLLEQQGFPGLADHRAAHQRLFYQIKGTLEHAKHYDELEIQSLLQFLRTWYLEHIEGPDKQYGPWLNDRGVF